MQALYLPFPSDPHWDNSPYMFDTGKSRKKQVELDGKFQQKSKKKHQTLFAYCAYIGHQLIYYRLFEQGLNGQQAGVLFVLAY